MLQSALYRTGYTAITFLAGIILANVLDPVYFGKLSLLLINASIISLMTGFGADGIVLHLLVNNKWNIKQSLSFIWTVIGLQLVFFLLIQGVYYFIDHTTLLSQVSIQYCILEFLYFFGLIVTEKYLAFFYSFNKAKLFNVILLGMSILYVASTIFIYQRDTITYLTALKLLAVINFSQLLLLVLIFHLVIKPLHFEAIKLKEITNALKKSSIIMITNVIQILAYRVDFWFIKMYHSEYDVGIYAQANKFVNLIWIIPNILSLLIVPKFSKITKDELSSLFRIVFLANLLITGITIISTQIFYWHFINYVYLPGLKSFYIMLPGYFCWATVIYFGAYFSWLGKFHYNLYVSSICFLAITLFDVWLIPDYSIIGAALSNTIVYSAILILYVYLFKGESGKSFYDLLSFQKRDLYIAKKHLYDKR